MFWNHLLFCELSLFDKSPLDEYVFVKKLGWSFIDMNWDSNEYELWMDNPILETTNNAQIMNSKNKIKI